MNERERMSEREERDRRLLDVVRGYFFSFPFCRDWQVFAVRQMNTMMLVLSILTLVGCNGSAVRDMTFDSLESETGQKVLIPCNKNLNNNHKKSKVTHTQHPPCFLISPNCTNYSVNDAGQVVLFCGGNNCAETTDMLTGMSEFEGFEFVRINCEAEGNKEVGRPRLPMNLPMNLGEATSSRQSRRPMNLCAQQ